MAVRTSALFSLYPLNGNDRSPNAKLSPFWDLGSRISVRLRKKNGQTMNFAEAMDFLKRNGLAIQEDYRNLCKSDAQFRDRNVTLPSKPTAVNFHIKPHIENLPWQDILSGASFAGVDSKGAMNKEVPELRWQAGNAPRPNSKVSQGKRHQKRSTCQQVNSHAAVQHEILGNVKALGALGLAAPHQDRRRSSGWSVDQQNDLYTVSMSKEYFRNDIKNQACGIDEYTGDRTMNREACHEILREVCDTIDARLARSVSDMDNVNGWVAGATAPFVGHLANRFHSYSALVNVFRLEPNQDFYGREVFEGLKDSLVSKAYADENCFNKCTRNGPGGGHHSRGWGTAVHEFGDVVCRAGCYDVTEQRFDGLYGLDSSKHNLDAERAPWNLTETAIVRNSYDAYVHRRPEVYLPGSFNLDPFAHHLKDNSPVIPICMSDYHSVSPTSNYVKDQGSFACTCGNRYGNESELFWSASNWQGRQKKHEYAMLYNCLHGPLMAPAQQAPAAYLVNMCKVKHRAVAPPGGGSHQQEKNKGNYAHNLRACNLYIRFYEENQHRDDRWLDDNTCKLWAANADDFHRGTNYKRPDMSYVNHYVDDGGCSGYRRRWKECEKGKKIGRCGYPAGY
ncbi:hypothetical protein BU26DRAFT_562107 [Trematosphaeria pertusa]|uniref:Uncharacterized protein n=1 Tax=Trematosphaeria pertusa TaxID=390896 RepID=A0A6A6IPG0_9PLEO|nr:uncharacterized protein BU26DRAFT_562107 [Trematosphaeria pertusa]KAF2252361.1 hypothetical protein BU26DRAFT_562107 [Trematosphaeria pertusa]